MLHLEHGEKELDVEIVNKKIDAFQILDDCKDENNVFHNPLFVGKETKKRNQKNKGGL